MNGSTSSRGSREKTENLTVRVAVHRGVGAPDLHRETAKKLVEKAWNPPGRHQTPARALFLFATADWCQDPSLPQEVRAAIHELSGYDVPLIGGSMVKLISSTEEDPLIENGVILAALYSQHFWMTVDILEKPHGLSEEKRREKITALAERLEHDAAVRLGYSAERYVVGMFPGIFRDELGQAYRDNELYHEILMAFRNQRHIFGGAAANHFKPDVGYQFANDHCLESGLALALVESDLSTGAMIGHGFVPRKGCERISVAGFVGGGDSGYEIAELDGKPATERIQELVEAGLVPLGRPIFGLPCGPDQHIILPLNDYTGPQGSLRMNRKLARGDALYVLSATTEQMIDEGRRIVRDAFRDAGGKDGQQQDLQLVLSFCCSGRIKEYEAAGTPWKNAVHEVLSEYKDVPVVGGLCAGEFGTDSWRRARANSMSISTCCVTGKWAGRSGSRKLQVDLMQAADRLSSCVKPREVMETALLCAVEAGAAGGQICVVDRKIGRILGLHLGAGLQPKGSPYNWPAVLEMTNREYTPEKGGFFPTHLLEWAMPFQDVELLNVPYLPKWEDLLTLIVRTRQVIFVPDSRDTGCSYQDPAAVEAGNLDRQLAIPLVGSEDNVLATLQLSLPLPTRSRDQLLNRGSFGLWIGFASKLASLLERAQEAEERGIMERLVTLSSEVMMTPVGDLSPSRQYAWCNDYLRSVIAELGANGAHMRLFHETVDGQEYELIGAAGHLSHLLPETRRMVRRADGGASAAVAAQGKIVTNTAEDTARFNQGATSVDMVPQYRHAMRGALDEIQSLMACPILGQGKVIGSFVVYSKQPYFFTERWQRIVEQTAHRTGSLFLGKKADYERALMDRGRKWMLQTIAPSPWAKAETQLRRVLALACDAVSADVASVFMYHKAPDRLVLHTAHNWAYPEGQEGRAGYALGEGWTGKLAKGQENIATVNPTRRKDPYSKRKYYDKMIPETERFSPDEGAARAGIRLAIGDDPIGVVTFHYYKNHANRLVDDETNIESRLRALEELLTPSVQAVCQEAAHQLNRSLTRAEETIWHELIKAIEPGGDWQRVIDEIRAGFKVERATLYYVSSDIRLEHGWTSPAPEKVIFPRGVSSGSELERLLNGEIEEAVFEDPTPLPDGFRLANTERFLYVAPIVRPKGKISGLLALANRTWTPEHPYELLNDDERAVAREVARTLGAAISIQEAEAWRDQLGRQLATATEMGAALLTSTSVLHEIKTPFAEIQQTVDWMKLHPQSTEEERSQCLEEILESCQQARKAIIEAAQQRKDDAERVDLGVIVDQAARFVRTQVPLAGVEFRVQNALRIDIVAQPLRIELTIINVLRNAIEAVKDGGIVEMRTEMLPHHGAVIVYNTGPHFSEDEIAAFFTVGYTTKGSMGYGMAIAKETVESAGGSLLVASPPEGGIEVKILIPRAAEQTESEGDQE